jgi:hypothetical protein
MSFILAPLFLLETVVEVVPVTPQRRFSLLRPVQFAKFLQRYRISPAVVYFPQGYIRFNAFRRAQCSLSFRTYLVSQSLKAYYYTQLIGDPKNPPTLLAASSFNDLAVIG